MKRMRWMLLLLIAAVLTVCGGEEKEQFREAEQNLIRGHYEEALSGFQEAAANDVSVAEAYRGQGIALLKLNRCEEAVEAFVLAEDALEEGKNRALQKDIFLYKAEAEYRLGDAEQALADCQAAIDLEEDARCYLLIGRLYLDQAGYAQAEEAFQKAVAADDDYAMYVDVYQSYVQKDMAADGERYLQAALEKGASDGEDYYQRGRIYFFMGDTENARQELIEASNKGYGDAILLLGKVYLSAKDPANARAMYRQYLEQGENQAGGYNGLALCDMAEGNYDSALEQIQQGLASAGTEEARELMFNEAVIYEKKLDFQTAKKKMEEYLRLYPDDEAAQKEYEFLLHR